MAQRARGSRETLFFLFFYVFILSIELIELNFVLTFLIKDARERGAHDDCQSPLPGQVGPVSRSDRAAVRLCAPYLLALAVARAHELESLLDGGS